MITAKKNKVDIAALTLPKEKAEDTAQHLVNLGIRAIWNFAHVDLDLSDKKCGCRKCSFVGQSDAVII